MKNSNDESAFRQPHEDHGSALIPPVNRRGFLELATLGSATLLLPTESVQADATCTGGPSMSRSCAGPLHGSLRPLAPGDVAPEGWLELYLQKQAAQLGGHLTEVSWPFTGNYWSGEEQPPAKDAWWPWEQKAYWIDGALRCGLTLKDERLMQQAIAPINYSLDHVLDDGYIGPAFARNATASNPVANEYRWPHTVFFRALAAYGEATGDSRIAAALRRHYLADEHRAPYGGPSRDVTNIEGMLWAYERTGDRKLLSMAIKAWDDFLHSAAPGDYESGDLHPERVFANTPIHGHGVTYAEKSKLPAILYLYTGNPEYLRFALAAQERIFSHHMLIDGIPSTAEDYRETTALDSHETCDITDHTWSWGYLLMATGDGRWADRIERACFNAGLGAIRKDWKGVQYFSCPNQVIATHNSNHLRFVASGLGWMAYRPNPGQITACCGGNVHRLFPNYVIRMWMSDTHGGLVAVLYGSSTVQVRVGSDRLAVQIRQETDYPFGDTINFTIRSNQPVTFPLSLRIPVWCKAPRLEVNGEPVSLPQQSKGFVRLERTFQSGDRITLILPMQLGLTYWPGNGLGLEHGPLVYALPVKEDWTPLVIPKWSTQEFPEWDARPGSTWNYAIAMAETEVLSNVQIVRKPMSSDPWSNPPVALTVPMKKIPSWKLTHEPNNPDRQQTPPLPELDQETFDSLTATAAEQATLVPYGCTHLRVTIFPKIDVFPKV